MSDVELRSVVKRYADLAAVRGVSLEVRPGELLTLLGPSGCGKTTILRLIAGFLRPDEGEVIIRGRVVNNLPPHHRDTAMVYQNYALFPHMSVFENVGFGLRMRKVAGAELARRVEEALDLVKLSGLERRYPNQLSGGQQQRVALARALVVRPSVLLLDEPLSNLDARLREEMRGEIRQLQQRVGITAIFVTHDQAEALAISDRIVVMNQGRVEQVGTPAEVYERPASRFVVDLIGRINLLEGEVAGLENGAVTVKLADGILVRVPRTSACQPGDRIAVGVRPERIQVTTRQFVDRSVNTFAGTVDQVSYLGDSLRYRVLIAPGLALTITEPNHLAGPLDRQAAVTVSFPPDACICLSD